MTTRKPIVTGLFGGSFDPPTFAHLKVGETAFDTLALDELWYIPTSRNPLKSEARITPRELRLALLKSALAKHPKCRIITHELEQDGPGYTVETVEYLAKRYPNHEFVLILGMDAFNSLPRWKRVNDLIRLVRFAVFNRPGYPQQAPALSIEPRVEFLHIEDSPISSTEVRKRVKAGEDISDLVPGPVIDLIEQSELYR